MFTFQNLYQAYLDCRKRKTKKFNHLNFWSDLEYNLLELSDELQSKKYKPGRSIAFVVKRPKIREIFAADFRDRVIHHLLYNYLAPIYEKIFIYDSWACRPRKGTHKAMKRLQKFCSDGSKLGYNYYLKMDIRSFFTSIDHQILFNLFLKRIDDHNALWLLKRIIFHDVARDIKPKIQSKANDFKKLPNDKSLFKVSKGKGLPIGNLTSQFFANVYLNELDQFIKHNLRVKYYIRYVDDFILLGKNIQELRVYQTIIINFLKTNLKLNVHPNKQHIRRVDSGINFVGYIVREEYILVRKRVINNFRLSIKKCHLVSDSSTRLSAFLAHTKWANARSLEKALTNCKYTY